jgi:hypothetical protein
VGGEYRVPCLRLRIRFTHDRTSTSPFHTCHARRASRNERFLETFRTAIASPALCSVRSRHRVKALQHRQAEVLPRLEYIVYSDDLVDCAWNVICEIRFCRDIFAHLSTSVLLFSSMASTIQISCRDPPSSLVRIMFGGKSGARGIFIPHVLA